MNKIKFRYYAFFSKEFFYWDLNDSNHPTPDTIGLYGGISDPQQYIGLKDVNKKEIYVGDIVEWLDSPPNLEYIAPVVYSPYALAYVLDSSGRHLIDEKYGDYIPMSAERKYEIIGNIFQKS